MDSEPVAFRNAAVSSAAGSLSCVSLWLLAHAAIQQPMHQVCFLPYIASAFGLVVLMLMAPSVQDALEGNSPVGCKAVLWAGTGMAMVGPVGSAWAAGALDWSPSGIELVLSASLLAVSAIVLKFVRCS